MTGFASTLAAWADVGCNHTYLKNEPCNSIWVLSLRLTSSGGFVTRWLAQGYPATNAEAVNQLKHLTTATVRVLEICMQSQREAAERTVLTSTWAKSKSPHGKMNAYSYINGKTSHVNMGDVSVQCDFTTEIPVKRNDIRPGLTSSHVNSQWLVNPRRIVPEKTQRKWTRGLWQDSCDARFLWKRQGMWKRSAANHINLQSHWTQDVFYLWQQTESGRVSATHVLVEKRCGNRERLVAGHLNLQSQWPQRAFYLRNHKGIWWGWYSTHFHWKTHESAGVGHPCHINLQGKWTAGAFYTRKQNDFSGVGGGHL